MIKYIVYGLLVFMVNFISFELLAQCQGQYTNDSGPTHYQNDSAPTNIFEKKKDFQLSLYQNIKKGNLDTHELFFLVINFMLMFFCIYSPKKKFFKFSMALYALPFIAYFISYPLLSTDSLIFLFLITLGMLIWGGSFSFHFKIDPRAGMNLISLVMFLAIFIIGFKMARLSHMGESFSYINYYLFTGQFEKNPLLLLHIFTGLGVMSLIYLVYALLFIKPSLPRSKTEDNRSYYLNRTIVYFWWGLFFIYAGNFMSYLLTWFVIGAALRDKEIIEDSFTLIGKYPYFFIAGFIMTIVILAKYLLTQDQGLRELIILVNIITVITLSHLFGLFVLKKIFKKKLSFFGMASVLPTFLIAVVIRNAENTTTNSRNEYQLATLIVLSLLGYFIP